MLKVSIISNQKTRPCNHEVVIIGHERVVRNHLISHKNTELGLQNDLIANSEIIYL